MITFQINYGTIAGLYSALAGVLAGFAFAGLIQVIATHSTPSTTPRNTFRSVLPLISAFVGLIASSLNYAVIAGQGESARAALLESVGGLGFSAAGMMLFYSLLAFLHGVMRDSITPSDQLEKAATFLRYLIIFGISPVLMILIEGGIRDQELIRYGAEPLTRWYFNDYVTAVLVLLLVGFGLFVMFRRRNLSSASTPSSALVSALAVAMAFASLIAQSVISVWVPEDALGGTVIWLLQQLLMAGFNVVIILATARHK